MPAPTERADLLRKRLEQFTRVLDGLEGRDLTALHRARVASRRLRELLPVLQLEADVTAKLSRRLRKVTQRLGTARELDVLRLLIDELQASTLYPADPLNRVASVVDKARKAERQRLMTKLPISSLRRLAGKLGDAVQTLETDDAAGTGRQSTGRSWRWAVDARVARRATGLSHAIDAAGALYLPERLHGVRIALKKLRYALEVATEAAGRMSRMELRTLKRGQDLLGRLHDIQMLIERARQVQASLTPPNVATWRGLQEFVDALEDDCRRLHGRYMHEREMLRTLCGKLAGRGRATASRRVTA
jgi:CHAD domain-containing protein